MIFLLNIVNIDVINMVCKIKAKFHYDHFIKKLNYKKLKLNLKINIKLYVMKTNNNLNYSFIYNRIYYISYENNKQRNKFAKSLFFRFKLSPV